MFFRSLLIRSYTRLSGKTLTQLSNALKRCDIKTGHYFTCISYCNLYAWINGRINEVKNKEKCTSGIKKVVVGRINGVVAYEVVVRRGSTVYKIISKPSDKILFQQDLNQLSNWSHTWAMSLSIPKCKTLSISRKKSPSNREYLLDGTLLTTVSETINLGITITDNLQWSQHIKQISLKANRTLGLIRRICRDISDTNTRKLLYCSIVRPKLEYASELWSPCTCKDKLLLETVQRRATKFILNYPKDMSYKDRLLKLNILPLECKRNLKDLVLIFKARAGHVDLGHYDFSGKPKYTIARAMHGNLTTTYLAQNKTI